MTLYSATFITDHDIRLYRFDTVIMDYINIYTLYMTYLSLSHAIFFIFTPYPLQKTVKENKNLSVHSNPYVCKICCGFYLLFCYISIYLLFLIGKYCIFIHAPTLYQPEYGY